MTGLYREWDDSHGTWAGILHELAEPKSKGFDQRTPDSDGARNQAEERCGIAGGGPDIPLDERPPDRSRAGQTAAYDLVNTDPDEIGGDD